MARSLRPRQGQFEINLYHTDNVLEACDDALALKRLVRLMAKSIRCTPLLWRSRMKSTRAAGCISISVCKITVARTCFPDAEGENSPLLKKMLAGMIDLMPSSMALLAPNVNSYRRFQPGMYGTDAGVVGP